jgi:hypothetical protein
MEDEMIRDREQPLNPPGTDAPDRKVKRQYIPMHTYDDIEVNNQVFQCRAEVEACGNRGKDLRVYEISLLKISICGPMTLAVPVVFLESYISPTGPTWRELIEREICRQAALLPCTVWEVEYEGDN